MEQYLQNSAGKKMVLKTITPIQLNRQQADLRQSGNRTTPWGNSVNHVDDWNKELRNGEATVKRMLNLESSKAVWFSGSYIAIHFQSLFLSQSTFHWQHWFQDTLFPLWPPEALHWPSTSLAPSVERGCFFFKAFQKNSRPDPHLLCWLD